MVTDLILIELTVFILLLALILKSDDDKTYEDVDHKKCNDDDEDKIEDGDPEAVIMDRTTILCVGVNRYVQ